MLGTKTIKYKGNQNYVPADIIPCAVFKSTVIGQQGTAIYDNGKVLYNYPKQHIENGESKSARTEGNYKKTVRMFKNARNEAVRLGWLRSEQAGSYFIESLVNNVPDKRFSGNESEVFYAVFKWLYDKRGFFSEDMRCQNGIHKLFGYSEGNICYYRKWNISFTYKVMVSTKLSCI